MSSQALRNVAQQTGANLLPENAQWKNRLQIRSETSSRVYTVAQRKSDNSWGCDCMGWKRYRHCKHLASMVPLLEKALKAAQVGDAPRESEFRHRPEPKPQPKPYRPDPSPVIEKLVFSAAQVELILTNYVRSHPHLEGKILSISVQVGGATVTVTKTA